MQFTVSTKPLTDAINLGVIDASVSKFYQKSCLAQLTADRTTLTINLEVKNVFTELQLKGSGDSDEKVCTYVDCVLFKKLINTIETSVVTLEFDESGLILHSGKSKFTLPKMVDDVEMDLTKPKQMEGTSITIDIDPADWKFISDHQMYAIAMSFITPVYTRVWLGENGDVLVGDFDNSMFTHSKKNKLGSTCLITDTIVNLFNSLPEGAKLTKFDKSYLISVATDGYVYQAEFVPEFENENNVGSYSADIILGMMTRDEANSVKIKAAEFNKFLNQAILLATGTENVIEYTVKGNELTLHDNNVDCKIALEKPTAEDYSCSFKLTDLKSVVSNLDTEEVNIAPMKQDTPEGSIIVGVCFWTTNMEVVIAGAE